jgi:hypothetical protein
VQTQPKIARDDDDQYEQQQQRPIIIPFAAKAMREQHQEEACSIGRPCG